MRDRGQSVTQITKFMRANCIIELEERNLISWAYKKLVTLLRHPLSTYVGIEDRIKSIKWKGLNRKNNFFNKIKGTIFDIKIAFFKNVDILLKDNNIGIIAKFCF